MAAREVDVVVVGAGGTGSAAAWQLAAAGTEVLLLEARSAVWEPGVARPDAAVFRVADADLAHSHLGLRSLPLWRELEQETSSRILTLTGCVAHGHTTDVDLLSWITDAAGKPGRWLAPEEAVERWPGIRYSERIFFHPLAGRIAPGTAVTMLRRAAIGAGAAIRYSEAATGLVVRGEDMVEVRTASNTYRARRVVVAAGPRSPKLAGGVPRQRVTWEQSARLAPAGADLDWPLLLHYLDPMELATGGYPSGVRAVPSPGTGIEVGFVAPGVDEADLLAVSARRRALCRYVHEWLPGADLDTMTAADHRHLVPAEFVLHRSGPVVVGTGFSGRGFQFLPAVGRTLAELTTGPAHFATP